MTLCPEVLRRQDAAVALARRCTVMLVLGDSSSANTRRLVAAAGLGMCRETYLLQDAGMLRDLRDGLCDDIVGVASGTSCPQDAIDASPGRAEEVCVRRSAWRWNA